MEEKLEEYYITLLNIAEDDLESAEVLLRKDIMKERVAQILLQQSAEKSIKSLLEFKKIQFPRTHSLEKLMELAKKNGINDLKEFENLSDELDDFAVDGRYDKIATIADDLDECTKKVRKLFITVKKYIKN